MIIQIGTEVDESRILWKHKKSDEWKRADIDDLIEAYEGRPRGEWIKVPGYVTPGGDPVWECSECGKGRHVYGVEASSYQSDVSNQQWVACPNCGARMVGDNDEK